jgi:hypothetical protein
MWTHLVLPLPSILFATSPTANLHTIRPPWPLVNIDNQWQTKKYGEMSMVSIILCWCSDVLTKILNSRLLNCHRLPNTSRQPPTPSNRQIPLFTSSTRSRQNIKVRNGRWVYLLVTFWLTHLSLIIVTTSYPVACRGGNDLSLWKEAVDPVIALGLASLPTADAGVPGVWS